MRTKGAVSRAKAERLAAAQAEMRARHKPSTTTGNKVKAEYIRTLLSMMIDENPEIREVFYGNSADATA